MDWKLGTSAADEALLLDLLNTTPLVDGVAHDVIGNTGSGQAWLAAHGRPTSLAEWRSTLAARDHLQNLVRGDGGSTAPLVSLLTQVAARPRVESGGLSWDLDVPAGRTTAVLAVMTWDNLSRNSPGRLRPCDNKECQLFLIDRSKPNRARWCSMATCGNRLKARRHYERTRRTSAG